LLQATTLCIPYSWSRFDVWHYVNE